MENVDINLLYSNPNITRLFGISVDHLRSIGSSLKTSDEHSSALKNYDIRIGDFQKVSDILKEEVSKSPYYKFRNIDIGFNTINVNLYTDEYQKMNWSWQDLEYNDESNESNKEKKAKKLYNKSIKRCKI